MITLTTNKLLPELSKYITYIPNTCGHSPYGITSYVGQACLLSDMVNDIIIDNTEEIVNELIEQQVPFISVYSTLDEVPDIIKEYELSGKFILGIPGVVIDITSNVVENIKNTFAESDIGPRYMNSKYTFVWGLPDVFSLNVSNMLFGSKCKLIQERLSGLYILELSPDDNNPLHWIYSNFVNWAKKNEYELDDNSNYDVSDLDDTICGDSIAELVRKLELLLNRDK